MIYLKSPASPQEGKNLWHNLLVKCQSFKFCSLQKPLSSNIIFFLVRDVSVPPIERSTARKYVQAVPDVAPKTASMTLSSSSPWDSTGFYYSPRYPQSHRGRFLFSQIDTRLTVPWLSFCILYTQLISPWLIHYLSFPF